MYTHTQNPHVLCRFKSQGMNSFIEMCPYMIFRWLNDKENLLSAQTHIHSRVVLEAQGTWLWHCVGHRLRYFIVYQLHTLAGKEANLERGREREREGE